MGDQFKKIAIELLCDFGIRLLGEVKGGTKMKKKGKGKDKGKKGC